VAPPRATPRLIAPEDPFVPSLPPRRLSAADTILSMLDDPSVPFCVGAVLRLEGATLLDAEGRIRLAFVREMSDATLHHRPLNRCIPVDVPGGVGRPVWVEDPEFAIADHVTAATLPEPTEAALWRAVEDFLGAPFPDGRPRWGTGSSPASPTATSPWWSRRTTPWSTAWAGSAPSVGS